MVPRMRGLAVIRLALVTASIIAASLFTGCGTASTALPCHAGCLCFSVAVCPSGCYPSQTGEPDGGLSQAFCSNGIVECNAGGTAWSMGTPMNNCGSGTATYLDGEPAGAFCCATHTVMTDAATDVSDDDALLFDASMPQEHDATGDESADAACPEGEVLCPAYCTNPGDDVCVASSDGGCPPPPFDCPPPK
jgi:hypothetical protein